MESRRDPAETGISAREWAGTDLEGAEQAGTDAPGCWDEQRPVLSLCWDGLSWLSWLSPGLKARSAIRGTPGAFRHSQPHLCRVWREGIVRMFVPSIQGHLSACRSSELKKKKILSLMHQDISIPFWGEGNTPRNCRIIRISRKAKQGKR